MKRKILLPFALLLLLAACATMPAITPQRTYYEAQIAYANAWDSYHAVWLALPNTDARKAQWVNDYHPKFLLAANLLIAWSQNVSDPTQGIALDSVLNDIQNILIQLAIRKGGT